MSGVEKVLLNNVGITHLYITLSFIDPTKGISLHKVYCTVWYFRLTHFKLCLLSVVNDIPAPPPPLKKKSLVKPIKI
jgi:cbb3-type cytochrome oxidase subunit 1